MHIAINTDYGRQQYRYKKENKKLAYDISQFFILLLLRRHFQLKKDF